VWVWEGLGAVTGAGTGWERVMSGLLFAEAAFPYFSGRDGSWSES